MASNEVNLVHYNIIGDDQSLSFFAHIIIGY